jgi:hypothetical protein
MAADSLFTRATARLRSGARGDAVPLAGAEALAPIARRTRTVRIVLAASLAACAVAARLVIPNPQGRRFLPSRSVSIVVLDLSSSIRPDSFELIRQTLLSLIATNGRFGVVLYSDVAYEALPPGTPASELRPFVRFFDADRQPRAADGSPLARTPWEQWFSAGTSISAGLLVAANALERDGIENGGVVLFSDLADDASDVQRLAETVALYSERQIPLQVVALDPAPENREFFRELLGNPGALADITLTPGERGRGTLTAAAPFPTWLAALGIALVALLCANEWLVEPLRWPRRSAA